MASVNKAIILGNIGKDPEVKYTPSGAAVCSVSIATTRKWKNKDTGERQEETEWHRVVFFERQAEIAGEYLKKGSPVYIEGRLRTRKWTDKDGIEKYTTEIVAESMQLLGGRDGGQGGEARSQPAARAPAPSPRPAQSRQPAASGSVPPELDDDDIPF